MLALTNVLEADFLQNANRLLMSYTRNAWHRFQAIETVTVRTSSSSRRLCRASRYSSIAIRMFARASSSVAAATLGCQPVNSGTCQRPVARMASYIASGARSAPFGQRTLPSTAAA